MISHMYLLVEGNTNHPLRRKNSKINFSSFTDMRKLSPVIEINDGNCKNPVYRTALPRVKF